MARKTLKDNNYGAQYGYVERMKDKGHRKLTLWAPDTEDAREKLKAMAKKLRAQHDPAANV